MGKLGELKQNNGGKQNLPRNVWNGPCMDYSIVLEYKVCLHHVTVALRGVYLRGAHNEAVVQAMVSFPMWHAAVIGACGASEG